MPANRTLRLNRETLVELSSDDLRQVVAGTNTKQLISEVVSCPQYCISWHTEQCEQFTSTCA